MSEAHPLGNRKTRRAWDQMVRETREITAEVPVTDDEVFVVHVPDTDTLTEVFQRRGGGDLYGAMAALFGDGDDELGQQRVARLREVAKAAAGDDGRVPITAWRDLMNSVMADLGLGASGEPSPVP